MISLIGLPGSGKSTVGRQLARRLQLPFFDSDHVIEQQLGCSIREYFEREGEVRFRDLEASVIDELTKNRRAFCPPAAARCCGQKTGKTCTRGPR